MTDTVQSPMWGDFKSYDEANKQFKLLDEDSGYVWRIDELSPLTLSPFVDLDEKGQAKPAKWQTQITFTCVDYANDDPSDTAIGQTIKKFASISMHAKATFYKIAKAAFGGEVDPAWKPNPKDLQGKLVTGPVGHKPPNNEGRVYAEITSFAPYRGKGDFSHVPVAVSANGVTDQTDDVPF